MQDFKLQIRIIAVLWVLVALCIFIDLKWPDLTKPPLHPAAATTVSGNTNNGNLITPKVAPTPTPAPLNEALPNPAMVSSGNGASVAIPNSGGAFSQAQPPLNANGSNTTTTTNNSNNGNSNGNKAATNNATNKGDDGSGVFYGFVSKMPAKNLTAMANTYRLVHILLVLIAIGFSFGFMIWYKVCSKKQVQQHIQALQNGQTILTNPPSDDTGVASWQVLTDAIFGSFFNQLVQLPGNEPKARMRGAAGATPFALELVSRRGDGIRHSVRLPIPPPLAAKTSSAATDSSSDIPANLNSKNKKTKGSEIPEGLVKEFIDSVQSQYRWAELRALPPAEDLLDLDNFKNKRYLQHKKLLLDAVKKNPSKQLCRGYALLTLAKSSFFPIKTEFGGKGKEAIDPLSSVYKALNCNSENELLACGIELVLGPPAQNWRNAASQALDSYQAIEMQYLAESRYSKPKAGRKGGGGGGLLDNIASSKSTPAQPKPLSPKQAAQNKRLMGQYQASRIAIEAKLEESAAFPVFIYCWAEGTELAVNNRLQQITNVLINQYNSVTFTTKDGASDGNTFRIVKTYISPLAVATDAAVPNSENANGKKSKQQQPQQDALAVVRSRQMSPYFKTEPSVLIVRELASLWHLPSPKQVQNDRLVRAGAMSPMPNEELIHEVIAPDGTVTRTDDIWRRRIGMYPMPDGSTNVIGLSEQGCLRGQYIPGKPGSGKSSVVFMDALQGLMRDDTKNIGKGGSKWPGNAVILTDPNGDMAEDTLRRIPHDNKYENRINFIDQSDDEYVVGLNLMSRPTTKRYNRDTNQKVISFAAAKTARAVNSMFKSLPVSEATQKELYKEFQEIVAEAQAGGGEFSFENNSSEIGRIAASVLNIFIRNLKVNVDSTPNIYRIVANGVRLAVEADPHATLNTMVRLIQEPGYRQALLANSNEKISANYFAEGGEFDKLFEKGGAAPAMSRLETLLRQEVISRIFCQRHQTLNIREACDKGEMTIFYFNPNMEGDKAFSMAVIFTLITQAIFSRTDIRKEQRRTTEVYLDEFQEMVAADKGSLEQWLSQARKFGGAIVLAHQYLSQIKEYWNVIKGTVGSFTVMKLDREDAEVFVKDFATTDWPAPQVARALNKLPPFSQVAKLYDNNQNNDAVLLRSLVQPPTISNADTTPLLVAIADPNRVRGYRLEPYAARPEYAQALQISTTEGQEGMWEPSDYGFANNISPTTREYCTGLVEEMGAYLWSIGQLSWNLISPDPEEAELMDLPASEIVAINSDLHKLRQAQELLVKLEALPTPVQVAQMVRLSNRDWQIYLASRRGRNLALNELIGHNPGLVPNASYRIKFRSILKRSTPVAEIAAEAKRPDPFIIRAEKLRASQRGQAREEGLEYVDVDRKGNEKKVAATAGAKKGKGGGKRKGSDTGDDYYDDSDVA